MGILKVIGDELRKIRRNNKLSLQDVADKAGVSKMYISEIERQKKIPSDDVILRLADIYKVNAFELFEGFNRIPDNIQKEIIENNQLFLTLYKIVNDENIKLEDKEAFYSEVHALYVTMFERK